MSVGVKCAPQMAKRFRARESSEIEMYCQTVHSILYIYLHIHDMQVSTLLELCLATDGEAAVGRAVVDDIIHLALGRDEILRGEGLEVRVEEDHNPELLFHIPTEGYSGEVVTGVPDGLQEFLQPMISAGGTNMVEPL